MANVVNRPNGHKWVQFRDQGKRFTIRLGKVEDDTALDFKRHIKRILSVNAAGEPIPISTARWLSDLPAKHRERLAKAGLIKESFRPATLGEFFDHCERLFLSLKPNTQRNLKSAIKRMSDFFGRGIALDGLTPGDAEAFRLWLGDSELAETTVSELCRKSRRVFNVAIDNKWLTENPFGTMKGWVHTDPSRRFFVSRDVTEQIIKRCEPEWGLLVALVRYGGLRCPSEVKALRWEYVQLPDGRFTVYSPKNARYENKRFRDVPIFPELRQHLQDAWDRAEDGDEYVLPALSGKSDAAIYSAFKKRLKRANISPWPKLFVNMRSSRETELAEQFPLHVVVAWLGNSIDIASRHYLQVTQAHFEEAADTKKAKPKSEATIARQNP